MLALDFGQWIGAGDIAPYAEIEHAIARVRRAEAKILPADPSRRWQLAPWIALGRGPLDAWQRLRAQLAEHPGGLLRGILDASLRIDGGAPAASLWMVDGSACPQVEALPEALFAVLDALRAPQSWSECLRAVCRAGAEPADADAVLRGLIEDVLLTVAAD